MVNFSSAFWPSPPDPTTPTTPESDNVPSSPARYVPPPHYATDPPLSRPDFDASGSDDSQLHAPPLSQVEDTNVQPQQLPPVPDNFELSSSDNEQPLPYPPPPLQRQPRTPPQPVRRIQRARPSPPLPPIPQVVPVMAYAPAQGVAAMPSTRSKLPPRFSGKVEHPVEDFLDEFEELADKCGHTGLQKVEMVIRYVYRSQRHVWEALPGYIDRNWNDFRDELCEEYVNPSAEGQFSKKKLLDFANKYARKRMDDETDVINYHRKFNTLSKTLLESGWITKGEYNAIFWRGFHPEDRQELHERLITKQPDKVKGQVFNIKDVLKVARAVFSGDEDFLLQEPPPRRNDSDRAQERRTERSVRNERESECDGCASRRRRARDPSPDRQDSGDDEAQYSDEEDQQTERTDTRRSASRLEPCDSRIINAGATRGVGGCGLSTSCEKRATQSYLRNAQTASLTSCSAFPNRSTELVSPPLPAHTNLQPRHLRRRSRGARKTQHQHRPHLLLPSIQALLPPFSVSVPDLRLALSAMPKTTKFARAPLRMNTSNRDKPPSSTTGSTYRTDNRSPSTAPSED